MKRNYLKNLFKLAGMFIAALTLTFTACNNDDDGGDDPINLVEDGIYVRGAGTALIDLNTDGLMQVTKNEVVQGERSSLLELYVAVKGGTEGFNIVIVTGGEETVYGPSTDFSVVAEADRNTEEPQVDFWRGSYTESETQFTVLEDGLYHFVIDTELKKAALAPVNWGLIGAATPGGWGESTPMTASFDLNKMEFVVDEITMLESEYKFRYSDGWKIILDTVVDLGEGDKGVNVNTNLGGTLDALVSGGDNIVNAQYGIYKYTMTWELGKDFSVVEEWVADGPTLAEYPEAMYIVGSASPYTWDEPGTYDDALMHKIAGGGDNTGIYWKICNIAPNDGFKLSAAAWGDPNLGFAEVDEFDVDGLEVIDNGGNISITDSGMVMVVLDLRNDMAKVSITPAKVYGLGDAFGTWDEDDANLFTIDNAAKTLTSPALTANADIRMYASHAWIPDWWNAEFNLYDTVIEYRNDSDSDQAAVAGTAGEIITLHFDDNTGSIQ